MLNQVWYVGDLYKYILVFLGYEIVEKIVGILVIFVSFNYECGVIVICDRSGLLIQIQFLGIIMFEYIGDIGNECDYVVFIIGLEMDVGGLLMIQYFRGVEESNNVVQVFLMMLFFDINYNFFYENFNLGISLDFFRSIGVYDYEVFEYGFMIIFD